MIPVFFLVNIGRIWLPRVTCISGPSTRGQGDNLIKFRFSIGLTSLLLALNACTPATLPINVGVQGIPGVDSGPGGTNGNRSNALHAAVNSLVLAKGTERELGSLVRTSDGQIATQSVVWTTNNDHVVSI